MLSDVPQLLAAVERAFEQTGDGSMRWPDPHPDHSSVPDEAYSRLTDPSRWRLLGARTDAWLHALSAAGLAVVDAVITWRAQPGPAISRSERVGASGFGPTARAVGRQVEAVLADAAGWNELAGGSWLLPET